MLVSHGFNNSIYGLHAARRSQKFKSPPSRWDLRIRMRAGSETGDEKGIGFRALDDNTRRCSGRRIPLDMRTPVRNRCTERRSFTRRDLGPSCAA
jgi:hypothetical protein